MTRTIAVMMLAISVAVPAQAGSFDGPRLWKEAVHRVLNGEPPSMRVTEDMEPLLPESKPWHVSLVVSGTDARMGTFCHGTMIAQGWVLTSASCVCSANGTRFPMDVVIERETSLKQEQRIGLTSKVPIWVYQVNAESPPQACFTVEDAKPKSKGVTPPTLPKKVSAPTVADLALIDLRLVNEAHDKTERYIELLKTKQLLDSLSKDPYGKKRLGFDVESVITAGQKLETQSGFPYILLADYLLPTKALLMSSSCLSGTVHLATVSNDSGTYSLCNDLGLSEMQASLAGTGVVLSDHKQPLMLGVYGIYEVSTASLRFTSVIEPSPDKSKLIVDTILEKTGSGKNSAFWFELKPRSEGP